MSFPPDEVFQRRKVLDENCNVSRIAGAPSSSTMQMIPVPTGEMALLRHPCFISFDVRVFGCYSGKWIILDVLIVFCDTVAQINRRTRGLHLFHVTKLNVAGTQKDQILDICAANSGFATN